MGTDQLFDAGLRVLSLSGLVDHWHGRYILATERLPYFILNLSVVRAGVQGSFFWFLDNVHITIQLQFELLCFRIH